MPYLEDVESMLYFTHDVVEVKCRGQVVWPPPPSYAVQVDIARHTVSAAGGAVTIVAWGITYRGRREVSRVLLSESEVTGRFDTQKSWIRATSVLGLEIDSAENVASAELSASYAVTWTEHHVGAYVEVVRLENVRNRRGSQYAVIRNTIPDPITWSTSRTSSADWQGDMVTISTLCFVEKYQDYIWSSGYEETELVERVSDGDSAVLTGAGIGLSYVASGSDIGRRYVLTYSMNAGSSRQASLTLTYGPGTIFEESWTFTVAQSAQPAVPSVITIDQRGTQYTSRSREVNTTFVAWTFRISNRDIVYYTPRQIRTGDPVYSDAGLNNVVANTYIVR